MDCGALNNVRVEVDSLGEVFVPKDVFWGAQTQRSLENFPIGQPFERMPQEIVEALLWLKLCCAQANARLQQGRMSPQKCALITEAVQYILQEKRFDQFPLVVFQTGSGTQTNMNVNEVIANTAYSLDTSMRLHPNDDVNMSQSSNDVFPSALYIASALSIKKRLIPAIQELITEFSQLKDRYGSVLKLGRTHLQDAVPLTFGQEISGWIASLTQDLSQLEVVLEKLSSIAIGATAVGTGLNAPDAFDSLVCELLTLHLSHEFQPAQNKFHALSSLGELVFASGAVKALACDLMKIANDIRWLGSGPRAGLNELILPANEPGSSIMPGKINPTQCEQVCQVAVQVMGCDSTIGFAASQGNFELNVCLPVCAYNFLQATRLLSESILSFSSRCVSGIKPNREVMEKNVANSLMLTTLFNHHIGYDKAAKLAQFAYAHNTSLKEANDHLKFMSEEQFLSIFKPEEMV